MATSSSFTSLLNSTVILPSEIMRNNEDVYPIVTTTSESGLTPNAKPQILYSIHSRYRKSERAKLRLRNSAFISSKSQSQHRHLPFLPLLNFGGGNTQPLYDLSSRDRSKPCVSLTVRSSRQNVNGYDPLDLQQLVFEDFAGYHVRRFISRYFQLARNGSLYCC